MPTSAMRAVADANARRQRQDGAAPAAGEAASETEAHAAPGDAVPTEESDGPDYVLSEQGGGERRVTLPDAMGRAVFKLSKLRAQRGDARAVVSMYEQLIADGGAPKELVRAQLTAEFGVDPESAAARAAALGPAPSVEEIAAIGQACRPGAAGAALYNPSDDMCFEVESSDSGGEAG